MMAPEYDKKVTDDDKKVPESKKKVPESNKKYLKKARGHIVLIFIVICTTFRPICPPAFFRYF